MKLESGSRINIEKFLSTIFLFENLGMKEIKEIAESSQIISIKKNSHLFHEGQVADAFYIVILGKLVVLKYSKKGEVRPLHYHGDREIIAEAAIFDNEKYPASCLVSEDSKVIRIPKEKFIGSIAQDPKIALKMLASYARRLRYFVGMIESLTLDGIRDRLMKYFIENGDFIKKENQELFIVDLSLSKRELAQILGTAPESLSRALKGLKEEGMIV